jgi:aryl-alcohol dehydrogenase-like predicted oxidoreductase
MSASPRPLGSAPFAVSPLALGSWRTFERIGKERSTEIVRAAADRGITFFDDARYNDETGSAPLATGYSEVLFGEVLRAAALPRADTVIANKLWWEHWPREDAAAELEGSLGRMGFDHVDLIYAVTLPDGLAVERAVEEVAGLLAAGKARAWGIANWSAEQIVEGTAAAAGLRIEPPAAAQLSYSLIDRATVEDPAMQSAHTAAGTGLVPSNVMAGGTLVRDAGPESEQMAPRTNLPVREGGGPSARSLTTRLEASAERFETTPAALAIAFALAHPLTASVLFGVSSVTQLEANVAAVDLLDRLTPADLAELRGLSL